MKSSLLKYTPISIVLIFLFFLPTQLGKHFFLSFSYISGIRIDYLAPTIYLSDFISLIVVGIYKNDVWRSLKKYKKWVWIILIIAVVNGIGAQQPAVALLKWLKFFQAGTLFIVFYQLGKRSRSSSPRLFFFILISLTLASLLQLVMVVGQVANGQSLQGIFYWLGSRYFSLRTSSFAKISVLG